MKEESLAAAPFASFPPQKLRSRREAEDELGRPCYRFKRPSTIEQDLASFASDRFRAIDPLGDGQLFLGSGTPLNWLSLAAYLHREGIVQERTFVPRTQRHDRPKLHNFGFSFNRTSRKTDGRTGSYSAFGASFDAEEAMSKTVGEALERYFLSLYGRDALLYSNYETLATRRARVLDLYQLPSFLPWQKELYPQFDWNEKSPLRWVRGEAFFSGEKTWLPAQLVFWNYNHGANDAEEAVLARSSTSGCAGHFSREEAVLSALLELIQRDAFLIFWMNRIAPPVLDLTDTDNADIRALLRYVGRYGLRMTFLNTTSDLPVPTVTCVIHDDASPEAPVISIGSSTGFDVHRILIQSAIEALLVNTYTNTLPTFTLPDDYDSFRERTLGRTQRLSLWKGPAMAERFAFFTEGMPQDVTELETLAARGGSTYAEQLRYVCDLLLKKGAGYDPYIYEVGHPVLRALGYHVVRAIVPALVPLHLMEDAALLGARRLREAPIALGHTAATEFNPWPHPFP
jgi:ribosomal protein S12 methylthiotransferase accessory factor